MGKLPKPKVIARLSDDSTFIEVTLGREEAQTPGTETVRVREIRERVRRPGGGWSEVRLWTSRLDEKAHPALELLGLYARRWEQEMAYRELKVDLRASGDSPLASHTPDTAAREIAALLVAMTMVARAPASRSSRRGKSTAGELRAHPDRLATAVDAPEHGRRPVECRTAKGPH